MCRHFIQNLLIRYMLWVHYKDWLGLLQHILSPYSLGLPVGGLFVFRHCSMVWFHIAEVWKHPCSITDKIPVCVYSCWQLTSSNGNSYCIYMSSPFCLWVHSCCNHTAVCSWVVGANICHKKWALLGMLHKASALQTTGIRQLWKETIDMWQIF